MKVNSADTINKPVSESRGVFVFLPVLDEWGSDLEHVKQRVQDSPPGWNKANPVARFARVKMIAVEVE